MKTVLVDLGKLKSLYTGLGQVSYHYGRELLVQKPQSLDLTYLVPDSFKNFFGSAVNYRYINNFRRYFPFLYKNYDLWHAIHQDSAYNPPPKTPYLLTIHDLNFLREKSDRKIQIRLRRLQKKINRAKAVVFISRFTESEAKSHLKLDLPTSVIYNGVDVKKHGPERPKFISTDTKKIFFSIGVITEKKNFHVLIDFMEKLQDGILVIAGDNTGNYARQIQNEINKRNLTERIILPGIISDNERHWMYKNCDAFFFPSINEGFGLPVIEALSYGKPVFLSTHTSLPEIAGNAGFYWRSFDPGEMAAVFESQMKTANTPEMIQKRIDRACEFSWEKNVTEYLKLYQTLLM